MYHDLVNLQLRSLLRSTGELEVSLARLPVPQPEDDQVVVRIHAAPINPSDLGLLLPGDSLQTASCAGTGDEKLVRARVSSHLLNGLEARFEQSLPVGNEGAGAVISTGKSEAAQALMGKTVAMFGGAMFARYRVIKASECLVLPPGTSAADGASAFVNPMTVLAMIATMRREGFSAIVHTAAASNLGLMLNRVCNADGIGLVNIVRSQAQVDLLRGQGAIHVCNSNSPMFVDELTDAIAATGAMLAFDAISGGTLAGEILSCMESATRRSQTSYNRYGSIVRKQAYLYGALDQGPTELRRNFGMAWGVGGWLLMSILDTLPPGEVATMRSRVAANLTGLFSSTYTSEIALADILDPDKMQAFSRKATGSKFLIRPQAEGA